MTDGPDSRPRGTARSVLLLASGNFAGPLIAIVTAPILARALGVEGRGEVAAAVAPVVLLTAVCALGLPEAITFFVSKRTMSLGRASLTPAITLFAVGMLGFAAGVAISRTVYQPSSPILGLLVISLASLPLALSLGAFRGIASGLGLWGVVNAEKLLAAFLRLILFVVLALGGGLTPTAAVIIQSFTPVVAGAVYLSLIRHREYAREAPRLGARTLFSYANRVWLGSIAYFLMARLDQVVMAPIAGVRELGLFVVAVAVTDPLVILAAGAKDVLFTQESADPSVDRLARMTRILTAGTAIFAVAVGVIVIPLIEVIFGGGFEAARLPTAILAVAQVAAVPGLLAGIALASRDRPGIRSLALILGALLNLVLLFALAPALGATGAALATLVANLFVSALNVLMSARMTESSVGSMIVPRSSDVGFLRSRAMGWLKRTGPHRREEV